MTAVGKTLVHGVLAAAVALGFSCAGVADERSEQDIRFDSSLVEQWKEANVTLPSFPRDADLIAVDLGPADTLKLFIDANSLSRASDRVLRLTLVVQSRSGARNVFFDGIRCETRQYKTYATGSSDSGLVPIKNSQWQEIPRWSQNNFRDHLFRHYACTDTSSALVPEELLKRLRH